MHSGRWKKQQFCDLYNNQKIWYQCISKKFYIQFKEITLQKNCLKCKKMLLKYISESKFFVIILILLL